MNDDVRIALLIDADNVSPCLAGEIFSRACQLGNPIVRRAYGMSACFQNASGWQMAQRKHGIVARPQFGNVNGKNIADIALIIDAMECLYTSACDAICVVSNDSDFTALAAKVRETGKSFYGIGGTKAPACFKAACTRFISLSPVRTTKSVVEPPAPVCPRCGSLLQRGWLKSRAGCLQCPSCGGISAKLSALSKAVSKESLDAILQNARSNSVPGCSCPACGAGMSIVRVSLETSVVEIDVCGKCRTVWYDRDELSALSPTDGVLSAVVSAGKAFRREVASALAADIRSKRVVPVALSKFIGYLKYAYHVPKEDIQPIIDALRCQKVIAVGRDGVIETLCDQT